MKKKVFFGDLILLMLVWDIYFMLFFFLKYFLYNYIWKILILEFLYIIKIFIKLLWIWGRNYLLVKCVMI